MFYRILLLCLAVYSGQRLPAQDSAMNDHMFPAAAVARPFIDYDAKGFIIKGKRTFIVSAGMEYARVPRGLWYDRLQRLKRAGFNTVEIYTFWNFHEPQQGRFDFSGDHDLDHFLKLVKELGMYCIARVGPYYCAEWDQGGYPLWLRFKTHLRVREPNDTFQKYTGLFFDRLLPVIRKNQINHGGSVIMVQLENEHTLGWGTVMPNRYFTFLKDQALNAGIEVPYFFSGLHHDTDPAGDKAILDDSARPNPWMSTEFWAVWFNQYGAAAGDADKYERFTRKIIARGGNGYNYYMAHGGSNFGYTNNDEDAASYDYGAAVGQAGDLRPLYYRMKRCAYFAGSFAELLENSATTATSTFQGDTGVSETIRRRGLNEIRFLDNHTDRTITVTNSLPEPYSGTPKSRISIAPGEIVPLLVHYSLSRTLFIPFSSVRILGCQRHGTTRTLVCYGEPGSEASLFFKDSRRLRIIKTSPGLTMPVHAGESGELQIRTTIPDRRNPLEFVFETMDHLIIRVLFISTALADKTWFVESNGRNYVLCGSDYPAAFSVNGGKYQLRTEVPIQLKGTESVDYPVHIYPAGGSLRLHPEARSFPAAADTLLSLSGWKRTGASAPAAVDYNDSGWLSSDDPAQMGQDGKIEPAAWYRTRIDVANPGTYKLECSGGDRAAVFIDGKWILADSLYKGGFNIPLTRGRHLLALYTAHDGRDKLPGYTGPLDSINAKGLTGQVWLKSDTAAGQVITEWRFLKGATAAEAGNAIPDSGAAWKPYKSGDDAFGHKTGYGWFEARIDKPQLPVTRVEILFKSVDEDATVFVDGKNLISHKGWNQPFRVSVTVSAATKWPLMLDVFIENHSNEGGIDQPVTVTRFGPGDERLTGWRMQGGTPPDQEYPEAFSERNASGSGAPAYFITGFTLTDTSAGNTWRVDPAGLDHGYVWVNGHNLGHYPDKISAPGLYIPGNWLKKGKNELKILDETGALPVNVNIRLEKDASRIYKSYISAVESTSVLKNGNSK